MEYIMAIVILYCIFKLELLIAGFLFFPGMVAYFYRKCGAIPWSVWEKNPNTMIWNNMWFRSDFARHYIKK